MSKVAVRAVAHDAISLAGLSSILGRHPQLTLVSDDGQQPDVIVFAVETLFPQGVARLRAGGAPVVLLASGIADASLMTLVECGVVAFLDRGSATAQELTDAVIAAAAGEGIMSKHHLGRLLGLVRETQATAPGASEARLAGLSARETDILRLIADGLDTSEVARELSYSESTVKHALRELTTRLRLRNRCHAVAFALRAGLI
ncbi:MAG TPA: response regulator transcription factor [Trebonia sp.]